MSLTPEQVAAVEAEARRIEQAAAALRDAERRQGEAQADAILALWDYTQGR
ncbi:hypothetical protein ACFWCR_40865 [Streptomyces goshikiensis]|uniref:hypothetical protein n=1 Tax=Streptomyces goshikiensis TaxID=1942 RepID=UPI0036B9C889